MVVNALIVWKKLIDICFLIKSSLLVLTTAYTKFRRMIGSMIWSCATGHFPRCVLLPHRHTGRLHWGKAESIQLCEFRVGQVNRILLIIPAMCSPSFVLKVRPTQRVNKKPHNGLLYRLTDGRILLSADMTVPYGIISLCVCGCQSYMKCMKTVVYLVHQYGLFTQQFWWHWCHFDEKFMTLFSANNMTSNIQHGVTSHYPSMSGKPQPRALRGRRLGRVAP